MTFLLSAGNVDDCSEAVPLLKLLPDLKDCDILADKAYGTKEIQTYLHDQSARYTIPQKMNTKQPWPFDKETYKRRNVIERFFNRLKEFRRAETCYDKRDDSLLYSGDDVKTVQANLGHATAQFTLDVYGHVTQKMRQESAMRMQAFYNHLEV